ncbi:hypothetical protein [Erwinia sp. S59]|uniref:hypothetical protein n=1 Tax=Erwinia sp. S59 TaxID=2769340 RepID=UPI00190BBD2D|nr:hypothetical protein [Erwinia sp. S59]MBK0092806.1 hypothetical protein [Erwinia sp. S59]
MSESSGEQKGTTMCEWVIKLLTMIGFAGDADMLIQQCWTGAATEAGKYSVIGFAVLAGLLIKVMWKKLRGQRANAEPLMTNHKRK